jgi:hypothetical protein
MNLTLQDSVDRLQQNEERLDQFVNDPAATGSYATRAGQAVPTVPALVEEVRQAASALGAPDGAANVGYTPGAGEANTVQQALRALEARPDAAGVVEQHEQAPDPHPQYADASELAVHQLAADPHPQYMTRAKAHAIALLF